MKQNGILNTICFLLIVLFAYTGLIKLNSHQAFYFQLKRFPWLSATPGLWAWFVPVTELSTVLLLCFTSLRLYGLYAATALLTVFTLFLIIMVWFNKSLPCSCGGVIGRLSWKQHIVFNAFFLLLAVAGIYLHKKIVLLNKHS